MTLDDDFLERVRSKLATGGGAIGPADVTAAVRGEGRLLTDAAVLSLVDTLTRDVSGAGPLQALLLDPAVTDVLVNGPADVYVDAGSGLSRVDVAFPDDAAVRRLAQRLAAAGGRRLDDASPYVDVRLADGTRLHAVLSPIAHPGSCISLRVPPRRRLTLDDLVASGAASAQTARLLADIVESRLAFLVSGGTGSGKTTLLRVLLSMVDPAERIVVVEDSAELRPPHPHVVSLESRPANVERAGAITLRDLVRQALRMRPDRLVVGEVRGAEVVDMLAALNTGHEGGCATVHANSAADVPTRLEALGVAAGLTREAVHAQAASALDAVIHMSRGRDGARQVAEIGVVERVSGGLRVVPIDDVGRRRSSDQATGR
ncbi:MAG TPA: TadA family conjugal transfer-associated ATPase [Nocardioidaceae bacterium]|nr:TadA family conjugal transfer-associated ATPase [Nocardioidaceae bacterium]